MAADLTGMLHPAGSGGLLFNPASRHFDLPLQQRLWGLQALIKRQRLKGLIETVIGVNNLLFLFDPLELGYASLSQRIQDLWPDAPARTIAGRRHLVPVDYGGEPGSDFAEACERLDMAADELAAEHCAHDYTVACVGSMPGFGYLVGLPEKLFIPRRQTPRTQVAQGSVMIGGQQTGIHPALAPSGWNVLGRTDLTLFDPHADTPCLLAPGDRVRFHIRSVAP